MIWSLSSGGVEGCGIATGVDAVASGVTNTRGIVPAASDVTDRFAAAAGLVSGILVVTALGEADRTGAGAEAVGRGSVCTGEVSGVCDVEGADVVVLEGATLRNAEGDESDEPENQRHQYMDLSS